MLLSFCFFFSFVHYHELFVFLLLFFSIIFLITYQKKEFNKFGFQDNILYDLSEMISTCFLSQLTKPLVRFFFFF